MSYPDQERRRFARPEELSETQKTPERLSDEYLGNLISSVGNHEAKALTLTLMRDGHIYSIGELHRKVIQSQGERVGWRIFYSIPFAYCELSLSSIGLVTKETLNPDLSTYGYQITRAGVELGIPLSGHLLSFSLRHPNLSLIDIFGRTSSPSRPKQLENRQLREEMEFKKRAPITRMKIFRELLNSSLPIRCADFAESIDENPTIVAKHLTELSAKGIVEYRAREYDKPFAFYKLNPEHSQENPPQYRRQPSLTQKVYTVLLKNPDKEWTGNAIAEEIHYKDVSIISGILLHLRRFNYLHIRDFELRRQSEITLTDEQRQMLLDLVNSLNRFQSQDKAFLEEGTRLAARIIQNPNLVSQLMQKAKEHSADANKRQKEEAANELLTIIIDNPGITLKALQQRYKEEYGRRLTYGGLRGILSLFSSGEKIIVEKQKTVAHYTAKE